MYPKKSFGFSLKTRRVGLKTRRGGLRRKQGQNRSKLTRCKKLIHRQFTDLSILRKLIHKVFHKKLAITGLIHYRLVQSIRQGKIMRYSAIMQASRAQAAWHKPLQQHGMANARLSCQNLAASLYPTAWHRVQNTWQALSLPITA